MEEGKGLRICRSNDRKGERKMKKIFCILLCICILVPLAACGGKMPSDDKTPSIMPATPTTVETKDDTVNHDEEYEILQMTVAEAHDGCSVFVYDEHKRGYCFYAYDEKGNFYRVLWHEFEELAEKGSVIVTDCTVKELEYPEGPPDGGFTPKYELDPGWVWSEAAWNLLEIADKAATDVSGIELSSLKSRYYLREGVYKFYYQFMLCGIETDEQYCLWLSPNGELVDTEVHNKEFSKYIGTDIESEIPNAIARINAKAGEELPMFLFYFQVDDEGYLCLGLETIVDLNPGDPGYGEGCGDHRHDFYQEKLGKA